MLVCVGARLTSGLLVMGVILLSVAVVLGVIITWMVFRKGIYHNWLRNFWSLIFVFPLGPWVSLGLSMTGFIMSFVSLVLWVAVGFHVGLQKSKRH